MARLKRGVAELRSRAINSLVLGIELFNRPYENGRTEAVLIFLQHAFEMLLKSVIIHKTGTIKANGSSYTYGFDKCLDIVARDLNLISADERSTLSALDRQRDGVAHFYLDISEDLLYLHAQSAVTLFDEIIQKVYGLYLADLIPSRVLPVSTHPPKDIQILLDSELSRVDQLIRSGFRVRAGAGARLRPVLSLVNAFTDGAERPSDEEINKLIARRKKGEEWEAIVPAIGQLRLDTSGTGIALSFKIHKKGTIAVRIATDGEPAVGTVIKQEYDIWDKFNISPSDLSKKLGLTQPKTNAVVAELRIQDDPECFKLLKKKSLRLKGYSKKALDRIRAEIMAGLDPEDVWARQQEARAHARSR